MYISNIRNAIMEGMKKKIKSESSIVIVEHLGVFGANFNAVGSECLFMKVDI